MRALSGMRADCPRLACLAGRDQYTCPELCILSKHRLARFHFYLFNKQLLSVYYMPGTVTVMHFKTNKHTSNLFTSDLCRIGKSQALSSFNLLVKVKLWPEELSSFTENRGRSRIRLFFSLLLYSLAAFSIGALASRHPEVWEWQNTGKIGNDELFSYPASLQWGEPAKWLRYKLIS